MTAFVLACLAVGPMTPARANADADKAAITKRLYKWADAFNARDSAGVCDLFSPNLISTCADAQDAGRDAVCGRLARLLARTDLQLSYSPDIQEIIVSGDLAAVEAPLRRVELRDGGIASRLEEDLEIVRAGFSVCQRQSADRLVHRLRRHQ